MGKNHQIDILFKMHADLQDLKRMNTETKKATAEVNKLGQKLKSGLMSTAGAFGIGVSIGAIKTLVTNVADLGAQLRDNAKAAGTSAEFLQVWRYAAEQNSVQSSAATTGLINFTRKIGEAQQGFGEAKVVLDKYNISLKDANGENRSMEDVLAQVSEKIKGMTSQNERLMLVTKLFETENAKLVNVLQEGKAGLDGFRESMKSNNQLISEDSVNALGELSDTLTELKTSFTTFWAELIADGSKFIGIIRDTKKETEDYYRKQAYQELRSEGNHLRPLGRMTPEQSALVNARAEELRLKDQETAAAWDKKRQVIWKEQAAAQKQLNAEKHTEETLEKKILADNKAAFELGFKKLGTEEQLTALIARRSELADIMSDSSLSDKTRNKALLEYTQLLTKIVGLETTIAKKKATDSSNNATAGIKSAIDQAKVDRAIVTSDYRLTTAQKFEETQRLYQAEITALDRLIKLEQQRKLFNSDPATREAIQSRIDGFQKEKVGAETSLASMGANPNSFSDTLQSNTVSLMSEIGPFSEQAANMMSGLMSSTQSWGSMFVNTMKEGGSAMDVLGNIGNMVFTQFLSSIVQMGINWVLSQALIRTGLIATDTLQTTLLAKKVVEVNAAEAATLPAKTAGAAAASVSSFGIAAVVGIAALVAALAMFGAFRTGGDTGDGPLDGVAGIVHKRENVWSYEDIQAWGGRQRVEAMRLARGDQQSRFFDLNMDGFSSERKMFSPNLNIGTPNDSSASRQRQETVGPTLVKVINAERKRGERVQPLRDDVRFRAEVRTVMRDSGR